MKVRWNRNSLRLRITPSELTALEAGNPVREAIRFPGSAAEGWGMTIQPGGEETLLRQQNGSALLALGDGDRQRLSEPETEGVYFEIASAASDTDPGIFRYYIEKDFPCIHPRAGDALEGPTETFAAPRQYAERQ